MTDRPRPDEYAPFYAGYIDAVPDEELFWTLENQIVQIGDLVGGLDLDHAYAPGKWTVREVVQHMIDTERVFAFRALWWARGDASPLPGFDQDLWVRHAPHQDVRALMEELVAVRASTVAFLRPLGAEAWGRGGQASGHRMTVRAAAWIAAGHMQHHASILRDRYAG